MRGIDSLRKDEEFKRIYRIHNSLADRNLVIYIAEGTGRLGIVCSKKVGNSVVRHTFARLVREAYRLNKQNIRKDIDMIVLARENAKDKGYFEIEGSFIYLLKKHSVYKCNEEMK